jgi:hypothetical protein
MIDAENDQVQAGRPVPVMVLIPTLGVGGAEMDLVRNISPVRPQKRQRPREEKVRVHPASPTLIVVVRAMEPHGCDIALLRQI